MDNFRITIEKSLQRNACWDKESFEVLPDVLFWLRQFISLSLGIIIGICHIVGGAGFFMFAGANLFLPFLYYVNSIITF